MGYTECVLSISNLRAIISGEKKKKNSGIYTKSVLESTNFSLAELNGENITRFYNPCEVDK